MRTWWLAAPIILAAFAAGIYQLRPGAGLPLGKLRDLKTTRGACVHNCGLSEPEADDGDHEDASPSPASPAVGTSIEQHSPGSRPPVEMLLHFDGLGVGFPGEQSTGPGRNPSDNSLAVGPNHIVQ